MDDTGIPGVECSALSPTNILDEWAADWSIFSQKHSVWMNQHELWRKFLRDL